MATWLPVIGYEGLYEVSNSGDVRNSRSLRVLRPDKPSSGIRGCCKTVVLSRNGEHRRHDAKKLANQVFSPDIDPYLYDSEGELYKCIVPWPSEHLLCQKLDYYGHKCRYCRVPLVRKINLTWDHAIPKSRGGPNLLANLLPACNRCNSRKQARTIFEYLGA